MRESVLMLMLVLHLSQKIRLEIEFSWWSMSSKVLSVTNVEKLVMLSIIVLVPKLEIWRQI